ncbi:hypothetical protein CYA_2669 [Synechococcus sp. JA-3-3Ab]|nr:hypothetical protein CYA_2669 [Synechococcus sp. JA-3-3Ab]
MLLKAWLGLVLRNGHGFSRCTSLPSLSLARRREKEQRGYRSPEQERLEGKRTSAFPVASDPRGVK